MVDTVPVGFNPGSDVANMGILGFDPAQYYTGRGPIEAASMGVECADNEMIFRCNLVSILDGLMQDFTADHISTQESTQLINELNDAFKDTAIRFVAGVSYRHIMVAPEKFAQLETVAPHDILDKSVEPYWPQGELMDEFYQIIKTANNVLAQSKINVLRKQHNKGQATSIWPWSQGKYPVMDSFESKYNKTGGIVTAVDLLKGLGTLVKLETPDVEGATGFIDTNYAAKVKAALTILETHDFCYLHIEAPDEAGHMGDAQLKIKAIEDFDAKVVGPIRDYQAINPDCVIMVLPDHPTPCDIKTHTHEPVPFCYYYPSIKTASALTYSEANAKKTDIYYENPWLLLTEFLQKAPCLT